MEVSSETQRESDKKYGAEDFQATVSWLACREECMPETVKISFSLPIVEQIPEIPQIWQDEVLKASNSFPVKTSWQSRYEIADGNLLIDLKTPNHNFAKDVQKITFIPFRQGLIVNNAPQKVGFDRSGNLSVSVPVDNDKAEDAGGVLVVEHENGRRGYLLAPEKASGLSEYEPINYETQTLPVIMLMAFLGGIILNFMPCIFPILSIKAIALVQGAYNRRSARIEALIYMVGVVSCFLLMATVLVWLREKGEHIGWGFQLQSPTFVVIMIVIFFIVFLMLLDLVNFRNPFANRVGRISFAKQKLNAFLPVFCGVDCQPLYGTVYGYCNRLYAGKADLCLLSGIPLFKPGICPALYADWAVSRFSGSSAAETRPLDEYLKEDFCHSGFADLFLADVGSRASDDRKRRQPAEPGLAAI